MATIGIENAFRLSWEWQATGFPELSQFGIHTAIRDEADFGDLFAAMGNCAVNMQTVQAPLTYTRYVISEWATGPGFTGWHQVGVQFPAYVAGGGDMLPHQLCVVLTAKNDDEVSIALGRRRNRTFFGPMRAAGMDTSGRITTGLSTSLVSVMGTFQSELIAVPALAPFSTDYDGVCIASPTEGVLMAAQHMDVGRRYDVLRSRAQKTPESGGGVATF